MPRRRALPAPPPDEDLPTDLAPLPVLLAEPEPDQPPKFLEKAYVRSALWYASGNLSHAASMLGTNTARLGNFVVRDPYLARERTLAAQLLVDRAEAVLLDSLEDADTKLDTAKWLIERRGQERGYASPIKQQAPPTLSFAGMGPTPGTKGALQIRWESDE
jgi:hypothetical protein